MAQLYRNDPEFGRICLRTRDSATRLSAKWAKGMVVITIPLFINLKETSISAFIEKIRPWLREHRPAVTFAPGARIELGEGLYYTFEQGIGYKVSTRLTADRNGIVVSIPSDIPLSHPDLPRIVSNLMMQTAPTFGGRLLLEPCRAEAERLGLSPRTIGLSHGHSTLGTCSLRGDIRISKACVFLTPELRRYIFCHELAHLTHHNHSAAFHRLLDTYLDGREAELTHSLHTYNWPIIR